MVEGPTARPELPGRAVSLAGVLVLAWATLVWASPVRAQTSPVTGRVVDATSGAPVAGGAVRVVLGFKVVARARSDAQGAFRVSLEPGRYAVAVTAAGYEPLRVDGVEAPGDSLAWLLRTTHSRELHNPLVTAPARVGMERVQSAASSTSVVSSTEAHGWADLTPADLVEALPGVTSTWTGVQGRRITMRGFNSLFASGPILLEDGRFTGGPFTAFGNYDFLSAGVPDVERVEVLRGPQSVLYGPDAVGGVIRVVTSSPIDRPGTFASLGVGELGLVHGAIRESVRISERSGLQVSGQYFRGRDWTAPSPADTLAPAPSPTTELGGARIRYDLRPWKDGEIVLGVGTARVPNSVLLLRQGPVQASDWSESFASVRVSKNRLWAQGFANRGDAGSSTTIQSGDPFVERSQRLGAQLQYGRALHEKLDVTAGFDASRTSPDTEGTVHGAWEDDDGISQVGGYVYGVASPMTGTRLEAALRVGRHSRFDGAQLSPRVGVRYDVSPRHTVRAAFNRGRSYPTPDLLFADRVTGRIPLLDTLGFDVRVAGLPNQGLTFDRRCPGGLEDRCMFSPLLPDIRMPATGAALWDAVLVPRALESETLRAALAGMGISPNGFAQIIGRPGPDELASRLVRVSGGEGGGFDEPAGVPTAVDRLRPATSQTFEVGVQGRYGDRFSYSLDLHATRVSDLVGPLRVATPTLLLEETSVVAFLLKRMLAVGVPAGVAVQIANEIADATTAVPLGTLVPDQREKPDVLLTYGNLGSLDIWGADLAVRWQVLPRLGLTAALSFLSDDCFDLDADGVCGTVGDVTLNAPTVGGSATLRWNDPVLGVTLDGRVRHAGSFPVNAWAYRGEVPAHTLLDLHGRVGLPWAPGTALAVTVRNVLDSTHREFVGTPAVGRLAMVTLQYGF